MIDPWYIRLTKYCSISLFLNVFRVHFFVENEIKIQWWRIWVAQERASPCAAAQGLLHNSFFVLVVIALGFLALSTLGAFFMILGVLILLGSVFPRLVQMVNSAA